MQVKVAKSAGACYGVKRALDMALEASGGADDVYTLGPLIHNPVVVAGLERHGVFAVADDYPHGKTVIVRSHGVTPEVLAAVEERGCTIVDATCPHVARAQKAAAKLAREGRHVIVVGEEGHPEVEGICAFALSEGGRVDVVSTPSDVPENLADKVGVVVQTTQRAENFDAVVAALRARTDDLEVKRTICTATVKRQDAARALAREVDAMVVIGGRNSSNTTRLFEICSAECPHTFHVESSAEIDDSWFAGCSSIGVTAGASTPEDQIREVVAHLEAL